MKFLAPLFALALLAQSASALELSDLVGNWEGVRVKTFKGKTEEQQTTTSFKKFQGKGLIEQTTVRSDAALNRILLRCFADGNLDSITTQKGQVNRIATGYWSFRTATLRIYTRDNDRTGRISIRLLSPNTYVFSASYSDGVKLLGRFTRR